MEQTLWRKLPCGRKGCGWYIGLTNGRAIVYASAMILQRCVRMKCRKCERITKRETKDIRTQFINALTRDEILTLTGYDISLLNST